MLRRLIHWFVSFFSEDKEPRVLIVKHSKHKTLFIRYAFPSVLWVRFDKQPKTLPFGELTLENEQLPTWVVVKPFWGKARKLLVEGFIKTNVSQLPFLNLISHKVPPLVGPSIPKTSISSKPKGLTSSIPSMPNIGPVKPTTQLTPQLSNIPLPSLNLHLK